MARLRIHRNDNPLFYKERNGSIIVTEIGGGYYGYYYKDFKSANGSKLVFEFLTPKMNTELDAINTVVDSLSCRIHDINEFHEDTYRKNMFDGDTSTHSVNYVMPEMNYRQLGKADKWLACKLEETASEGIDTSTDFFNVWTSSERKI